MAEDKEKAELKKKKVEILTKRAEILKKQAKIQEDKKKAEILKKKAEVLKQRAEMEKHPVFRAKLNLRQKAADKLSLWVGSWTFIIVLVIFILVWAVINVYAVLYRWDPYPFILLNFVLSALAAIQAPIILMSQERQSERDRINAKYDYQVTRKAEREIQNMQQDLDEIKFLIKNLKK